jgi:dienelactone hydrolase
VPAPFHGTLCAPYDGRRHPAVILFGGAEGGDSLHGLARDFAAHGYVAASVVYFGTPGAPATLVDVPVELAGAAIEAVARRQDVDGGRLALFGTSKGGEYALVAASTYPAVRAVVAAVPAPFAWFGLGEHGMPTGCAWSRGGRPLPCVPQDPVGAQEVGELYRTHQPISFRAAYERSRANETAVAAAFFPLEQIRGPVLCLAGDDDRMWSSRAHCEMVLARLRIHQHPHADRMISYPDAGHTFLTARAGPSSALVSVSVGGYEMLFDGTPEGDARAAEAAWVEIYRFLEAALAP